MRTFDIRIPAAVAAALALVACGEKKPPEGEAPQAQPALAAPAPAPAPPTEAASAPAPALKAEATPAPAALAPSGPVGKPVLETAPAPKADTAPPAATKTAPAAPPATAPAPPTAGAASARAKVGADKCKMCHRVQHQSWAASPHAAKGLDCEGCHGNGGDYWPAGMMRDRSKAEAAGLVMPTLASCKKCHGAKADTALFAKVHAHKVN